MPASCARPSTPRPGRRCGRRARRGGPLAIQDATRIAPSDELHDEVREPVRLLAEVEHAHGGRVIEIVAALPRGRSARERRIRRDSASITFTATAVSSGFWRARNTAPSTRADDAVDDVLAAERTAGERRPPFEATGIARARRSAGREAARRRAGQRGGRARLERRRGREESSLRRAGRRGALVLPRPARGHRREVPGADSMTSVAPPIESPETASSPTLDSSACPSCRSRATSPGTMATRRCPFRVKSRARREVQRLGDPERHGHDVAVPHTGEIDGVRERDARLGSARIASNALASRTGSRTGVTSNPPTCARLPSGMRAP